MAKKYLRYNFFGSFVIVEFIAVASNFRSHFRLFGGGFCIFTQWLKWSWDLIMGFLVQSSQQKNKECIESRISRWVMKKFRVAVILYVLRLAE
jgi:hypothetical protein